MAIWLYLVGGDWKDDPRRRPWYLGSGIDLGARHDDTGGFH